jgi:hypothetical protein
MEVKAQLKQITVPVNKNRFVSPLKRMAAPAPLCIELVCPREFQLGIGVCTRSVLVDVTELRAHRFLLLAPLNVKDNQRA